MTRHLFIVESPGKTRKIEHYLGTGWTVLTSFGHVRDLPEKEIGVEPPDFKPHYRILAKQAARVAQLKQAAQQADAIYLGTDPDREGEAIAWHLYMALGMIKNLYNGESINKCWDLLGFHECYMLVFTLGAMTAAT